MKLVRNCVRSECPSWEYPNRIGIDESEAERRSFCSYQQTSNHGVEPIKLYRHHPGHCLARRSWRRRKRPFLLGRRSLSRRVALKTYKFIHDAGHSNLSPGLWPKEVAVRKGCFSMYGLACPPAAREGLALSGSRRLLSLVGEKRGWARHFCSMHTTHSRPGRAGEWRSKGCEACVTAPNMRWLTSREWLCRREAMKRSRAAS
jgi:hypothetical protein